MINNDMKIRMETARAKVLAAIKAGGGQTVLSTGITGDDARLARAVTEIGVKMLEPNHPAVALARGFRGVTNMHAAEQVRHGITITQMAEVTRGIRNVIPDDVFITVGIPGGFTETVPCPLSEADLFEMAQAGADGLHVHKSSLDDLEALVNASHKAGLLVDAYIGKASDVHPTGIFAETPEEVYKAAKQMEGIGTDMIGLMTGMTYEGVNAGEIHPVVKERLAALVEAVKVPTLAEGGINLSNFSAFKKTKVSILVIGTAIDQTVEKAAQDIVKQFMT